MKLALVAALMTAGCSYGFGSALKFEAPHARFPISMTRGLVDANGIVEPTRVRRVGRFEFATDGCIPAASVDLSRAVNDQVQRAGGDALVQLEIFARREDECIEAKWTAEIVKVER